MSMINMTKGDLKAVVTQDAVKRYEAVGYKKGAEYKAPAPKADKKSSK